MDNYALATDLYQLTMGDGYLRSGMRNKHAVFDLFVRSLPKGWGYMVACGIEESLRILRDLQFTGDQIAYLKKTGKVSDQFLDYLYGFRFTGNVRGVLDGSIVYPNEPILEVSGPLIEVQMVETILLTIINYQTLVATKASRIVQAAKGKQIVDFGLRRAPGPEAGLRASRAAFIAGVKSTSNVQAGFDFGMNISGTHAHAFVLAFPSELEAFRAWCATHDNTALLVDTYDIERGIRNVITVAKETGKVRAIRLDSGDFDAGSRLARFILDQNGLQDVKIIVSGDMNEYKIKDLADCPIDIFGVGTDMVTGRPDATLGGVYKLVEIDGMPKIKIAEGKKTRPGAKQVWRYRGMINSQPDTMWVDIMDVDSNTPPDGFWRAASRVDHVDHKVLALANSDRVEPVLGDLLLPVRGDFCSTLMKLTKRHEQEIACVRASLKDPCVVAPYTVGISKKLFDLTAQAEALMKKKENSNA